jgi:ribosome biogenesis protein ERB1
MPLSSTYEHKRRFLPSKWENNKIMKLVRAIRRGHLKFVEKKKKPRWYSLWNDNVDQESKFNRSYISAPKIKLPDHSESYNPPEEYLWTKDEIEKWEKTSPEERITKWIPQKYKYLREVPSYKYFVEERFERCLDLYLCPRVREHRKHIDPESLLPKLPLPKDLQPFPTKQMILYKGHSDIIRSIHVDFTGQWLISGSDDKTARLWEVSTGRCIKLWEFPEKVRFVSWCPNMLISLICVIYGNTIVLMNSNMTNSMEIKEATENVLLSSKKASLKNSQDNSTAWKFLTEKYETSSELRILIETKDPISDFCWHRKGDYFSTVSSEGKDKKTSI